MPIRSHTTSDPAPSTAVTPASESGPDPKRSVGDRITLYRDGAASEGTLVEDYAGFRVLSGEVTRDWAPLRRWAIALDSGHLVFADDHELDGDAVTVEPESPDTSPITVVTKNDAPEPDAGLDSSADADTPSADAAATDARPQSR